jgi:hypothetical protein
MSRNVLYLLLGVVVVVALGLGYQLYQDRQTTSSIKIDIGKSGVVIQSH